MQAIRQAQRNGMPATWTAVTRIQRTRLTENVRLRMKMSYCNCATLATMVSGNEELT